MVATVRGHYGAATGTKLGDGTGLLTSIYIKNLYRSLSKLESTRMLHRLPILQQHFRKMREQMKIDEARDMVLWALWLTQWRRVCRGSNLLRPSAERARAWVPERDSHRRMLEVE